MLTTLVFRFDDDRLDKEVLSHSRDWYADRRFYSFGLEALLVTTLVPMVVVMVYPSQAERAQRTIASMATETLKSLEQSAMNPDARGRVRRAVDAVRVQATISQAFTSMAEGAEAEDKPLTIAGMFEQIAGARRSAPAGRIKVGDLTAFWRASEPPDRCVMEQGRPKIVVSYSRVNDLRNILTESKLAPGDTIGIDEVEAVVELLMEHDFQEVNNPAVGRVYYLNKRTRKSRWKLPTVDEWLLDLHTAKPPQLTTTGSTQQPRSANKQAPPPLFPVSAQAVTEMTENPLYPLAVRPTTAAAQQPQQAGRKLPPRRQQAQRAGDTDQPRQGARRARERPANVNTSHNGEWERRYSDEHSRYYYLNRRTKARTWNRPTKDAILVSNT